MDNKANYVGITRRVIAGVIDCIIMVPILLILYFVLMVKADFPLAYFLFFLFNFSSIRNLLKKTVDTKNVCAKNKAIF